VLPGTAPATERTRVIARYTMMLDLGHALGALAAGAPALLARATMLGGVAPHRATLLVCAAGGLVALVIYRRIGTAIEVDAAPRVVLTPRTRAIVVRISSLFAIDSLAGGFLTTAMLSFFFFERFGVSEAVIASLFFGARILNAVSHLGAAWLARRIGLVNTMVFTHIPSSIFLIAAAFAPNLYVALALLLLRSALSQMDVPTRTSYVMAVVTPAERPAAASVTAVPRSLASSISPAIAGVLLTTSFSGLPLVVCGALKIAYDLALLFSFRHIKPPEEQGE
jgi:hypothetical protein